MSCHSRPRSQPLDLRKSRYVHPNLLCSCDRSDNRSAIWLSSPRVSTFQAPTRHPRRKFHPRAAPCAPDSSAPPPPMWGFRAPAGSPPAGTPPEFPLRVPAISWGDKIHCCLPAQQWFSVGVVSPRGLPYQANGALSPRRRGMDRRRGLIVGDKDKSGAVGNTVGESRLGDEWSLNPTSTICKGAKKLHPLTYR